MTEHALLSPSAAERWSRCTMAPTEEARFPDSTSPAAEEGTAAHAVFEALLTDRIAFNPLYDIEEMKRVLDPVVRYVNERLKGGHTLHTEQKLDISTALGFQPETVWGTADVLIVSQDYLEVIDLKYGRGNYVSEEENLQMALYAVGALAQHFPFMPPENVYLTIAQPRFAGAIPIRTWECSPNRLNEIIGGLARAAREAYSDAPKFNPGEKQCKWCRARFDCEARKEHFTKTVENEFAPVAESLSQGGVVESHELGTLLLKIPEIENFVRDIREEAYRRAGENALPGWKLIRGRASRKWADETETLRKARAWKINGHALGLDGAAPRQLLSPAKMEKLPGLSKHQQQVVGSLQVKSYGTPKLVPESDPHPAVSVDVEGQFAPVNEPSTANS